jgi:integrase/recombinase XerD
MCSDIKNIRDAIELLNVLENIWKTCPTSGSQSAEDLIGLTREKLTHVLLGLDKHINKSNEELLKEYLDSIRVRVAESTFERKKYVSKGYLKLLGSKPLAEVTYKDIRRFADLKVEGGCREETIRGSLSCIRKFHEFLSKEYGFDRLDIDDICASEYSGRVPPPSEREPLSREEVRELVQAAQNIRNRLIILFLYYTGARVSEISNLKLEHVNTETGAVRIERGKGGKSRWVWYNPKDLGPLVELWLKSERSSYLGAKDSDYFFVSRSGRKLDKSGIEKIVHNAATLAGIQKVVGVDAKGRKIYKVICHALRHTHVAHAEEDGIPKSMTQLMMGHEHLSMTLQYGKPRIEKVFEEYGMFKGLSTRRPPIFRRDRRNYSGGGGTA